MSVSVRGGGGADPDSSCLKLTLTATPPGVILPGPQQLKIEKIEILNVELFTISF